MARTALLVRCNAEDADRIRFEANKENGTISSYVLRISAQAVAADSRLFQLRHNPNEFSTRRSPNPVVPRTAILVRCDNEEAERIREAAKRRDVRINTFILDALKSTWNVQMPLRIHPAEAPLGTAQQ